MIFKTPEFWQKNTAITYLLSPFSWIYFAGYKIKALFSKPYKSAIPVICVGGVVAGGSGKSPVLQAIVKLLLKDGRYQRPVILTRGYGGILKGPTKVDAAYHSFSDVGDEALMHLPIAPVIVSKDRSAGAKLAEAMGADIIIMDDGLQNFSLQKDLSFLVIDSIQGLRNNRLIPAGPLREPFESAHKKCAGIIETGGKSINLSIKTTLNIVSNHDKEKTYFAFAGLGRPEKFKETLISNSFRVTGFKSFPDHYPYTHNDIEFLLKAANEAQLITTQKDFVRIPEKFKTYIDVLLIELSFDNEQDFLTWLGSLKS
jgi:tetraacyldisaccharide 4'-kinase